MRSSMLWMLVGSASLVACVAASLGRAPALAQEAPGPSVSAPEEMLKDVEVMRRVLVREALTGRGTTAAEATGTVRFEFSQALFSGYGAVSEAFVVPGQGATFLLRTSDAVAPPVGGDESTTTPEKPSAWDEEAAALEGKPLAATTARRRAVRYDAAKVEALRTRVLDALAKYGQKIRGLAASERITVIVVGGGGGNDAQVFSVNDNGAVAYRALTAATVGRGADGGRTTLTMHVSVSDCQAAASGALSAEEFRRRAVVAAY